MQYPRGNAKLKNITLDFRRKTQDRKIDLGIINKLIVTKSPKG